MKEEKNKITPCLWFSADGGKLNKILEYYQKIFDKNFHANAIIPLGETPSGYAEMCEIQIFGQSYLLMSTAEEHHPFNDAMALMINCENQEEIDHFWNYFTQEGQEAPCGWCIDRYGFRWQIIPKNMGELMSQPNAQQVMMSQTKIIIDEYFKQQTMNKITIKTQVKGDVQQVWNAYTDPQHIINWNFATPEWHCPKAANDLRIGGEYLARMEAKDGSFGFDFKAIYKELTPEQSFVYVLEDGREVGVTFTPQGDTTEIVIVFDPENQNPIEMQQAGWQAILDNFKRYAESIR